MKESYGYRKYFLGVKKKLHVYVCQHMLLYIVKLKLTIVFLIFFFSLSLLLLSLCDCIILCNAFNQIKI